MEELQDYLRKTIPKNYDQKGSVIDEKLTLETVKAWMTLKSMDTKDITKIISAKAVNP